MKTKKFLSLVLALAMIFSMSVSVFAAQSVNSNSTNSNEFKATAKVKVPAIDVSVPSTGTIFINPMGFKVTVASGEAATRADVDADTDGTKVTTNKVVSPLNIIENTGPMRLDVKVSGVLALGSGNKNLQLATSYPFSSDESRNVVFIYANFGAATYDNASQVYTMTNKDRAYAANKESEGIVALSTIAPLNPPSVGTLAAATSSNNGYLAFQLLGDCAPNARQDWNDGDSVDVKLTFSFKPLPDATT